MDVLGIDRYVSERLDISPMSKERFDKLVSDKFTHLYFPKSKYELCGLIDELVGEYGYECNLNVIDVSDITDMSGIFFNSKFNGDISMWDVSNATTMFAMFRNSKFNGDISRWNVGKVLDMRVMFAGSDFNGDISNWNVRNVRQTTRMFEYSCFDGDLSKWELLNATNTRDMFEYSPLKDKREKHPRKLNNI